MKAVSSRVAAQWGEPLLPGRRGYRQHLLDPRAVTSGGQPVGMCRDGDGIALSGIDPWEHEWIEQGEQIVVADPSHPSQRHDVAEWVLHTPDRTVGFRRAVEPCLCLIPTHRPGAHSDRHPGRVDDADRRRYDSPLWAADRPRCRMDAHDSSAHERRSGRRSDAVLRKSSKQTDHLFGSVPADWIPVELRNPRSQVAAGNEVNAVDVGDPVGQAILLRSPDHHCGADCDRVHARAMARLSFGHQDGAGDAFSAQLNFPCGRGHVEGVFAVALVAPL